MNYPDLIWRLVEMLLEKDSNQEIITNNSDISEDVKEQE